MNAGLLIVSGNGRSQVCISGRFNESGHTILVVKLIPEYAVVYVIVKLTHITVSIVFIRICLRLCAVNSIPNFRNSVKFIIHITHYKTVTICSSGKFAISRIVSRTDKCIVPCLNTCSITKGIIH